MENRGKRNTFYRQGGKENAYVQVCIILCEIFKKVKKVLFLIWHKTKK